MGASSSTSINKVITDSAMSVMVENSTKCSVNNANTNSISLKNLTGGNCSIQISNLNQTIDTKINLECIARTVNNTELQNQFEAKLKAAAESLTSGLNLGNVSVSKSANETISTIKNEIKLSNIAEILLNNTSNNTINIENISGCPACCGNQNMSVKTCDPEGRCTITVDNITQRIVSNIISKLCSDNENVSKSINKLSADLDASSKSTTEGLKLQDIFGIIAGIICLIIFGLLIFGGGSIYMVLKYIVPIFILLSLIFGIIFSVKKEMIMAIVSFIILIVLICCQVYIALKKK